MPKLEALKRRIAPSVPLTLKIENDGGSTFERTFRLSFDFNAFAVIQDKTGVNMAGENVWAELNPVTLSVMFWASLHALQPEFASDEGLCVVRSYMDVGNQDQIAEALFDAHAACLPADRRKLLMDAKERALRGDPIKAQAVEVETPGPEMSA